MSVTVILKINRPKSHWWAAPLLSMAFGLLISVALAFAAESDLTSFELVPVKQMPSTVHHRAAVTICLARRVLAGQR